MVTIFFAVPSKFIIFFRFSFKAWYSSTSTLSSSNSFAFFLSLNDLNLFESIELEIYKNQNVLQKLSRIFKDIYTNPNINANINDDSNVSDDSNNEISSQNSSKIQSEKENDNAESSSSELAFSPLFKSSEMDDSNNFDEIYSDSPLIYYENRNSAPRPSLNLFSAENEQENLVSHQSVPVSPDLLLNESLRNFNSEPQLDLIYQSQMTNSLVNEVLGSNIIFSSYSNLERKLVNVEELNTNLFGTMVININSVPSYNRARNDKAKYTQYRTLFKYAGAVLKTIIKDDNILLGFVDEAAVTSIIGRKYGKVFAGITPVINCPLKKIKMSILSIVFLGFGILYKIVNKAVDWKEYSQFLSEVIEFARKYICNNQTEILIIEDNCPMHAAKCVEEQIQKLCISLIPIVPYSPSLNGVVEGYFGFVKLKNILTAGSKGEVTQRIEIEKNWKAITNIKFTLEIAQKLYKEWISRMDQCEKGFPFVQGHIKTRSDINISKLTQILVNRLSQN